MRFYQICLIQHSITPSNLGVGRVDVSLDAAPPLDIPDHSAHLADLRSTKDQANGGAMDPQNPLSEPPWCHSMLYHL